MTMMKWWLGLGSGQSNRHAVKVSQLKLQLGLFGAKVSTTVNDKLAIELSWIKKENHQNSSPPSCLIIPFQFHHRTLKRPCTHTTPCRRFITSAKTPSFVWDDRDLCVFELGFKDVCHVTFHVLYGEGGVEESKGKRTVVGKVFMTLAMEEMKNDSNIHRKLPIRLKVNGLIFEATLSVCLRLCDSARTTFENTTKPDKKHRIIEKVKYLTCLTNKNNGTNFDSYESDDSPVFDSDDSSNESTTSGGSSSSNSPKEPRITFQTSEKNQNFNSLKANASKWETSYILSRDCQTKLKTNVFFASFDQRSEKAYGESACTVLVALIAHWLHSNKGSMPTRTQFDSLITQGSSEWRKLCKSDYYSKLFPDKHFDLETVIDANLRPITVLPQKSYTGFFSPEKFHCLEGVMSFDEIWKEIKNNKMDDFEARIYIVSWNDHFFILKVEVDAYYIIDSLGERLFEGCQRAFVLKFDDSSVMYGKKDDCGVKSNNSRGEQSFEVVCRGKECCKEFIKRFLAAILVRQLEKEEKKRIVSNPNYHRQLQIDFHFSLRLQSEKTQSHV